MMEVVIQKSRRKDKKLDAVIDGKKTISFGLRKRGWTSRFIRMTTGRRGTSPGIRKNESWRELLKTAGFYS
jgi:hypothetical protein